MVGKSLVLITGMHICQIANNTILWTIRKYLFNQGLQIMKAIKEIAVKNTILKSTLKCHKKVQLMKGFIVKRFAGRQCPQHSLLEVF